MLFASLIYAHFKGIFFVVFFCGRIFNEHRRNRTELLVIADAMCLYVYVTMCGGILLVKYCVKAEF